MDRNLEEEWVEALVEEWVEDLSLYCSSLEFESVQ
jgi:hypothetical protein